MLLHCPKMFSLVSKLRCHAARFWVYRHAESDPFILTDIKRLKENKAAILIDTMWVCFLFLIRRFAQGHFYSTWPYVQLLGILHQAAEAHALIHSGASAFGAMRFCATGGNSEGPIPTPPHPVPAVLPL